MPRLRMRNVQHAAKAKPSPIPSLIPENPTKGDLLYVFQRRMICSECAEKRGLRRQWLYSDLGSFEGPCQTCGREHRMMNEVMCVH